ncbi:MAG: hypothetical protein EOP02_25325 [Proteobacteria bacterium]|nr:MAG: hypothetical protein EOP02_25325 [Pseudomonadota bacterium]
MNKYLGTVAAAILLISSPAWSQAASTHTSSKTKVTTTNGKVTSATSTTKKTSCRNDKGQFVACSSSVKTSTKATVTKDRNGKCRWASGPKKGQFTKCP